MIGWLKWKILAIPSVDEDVKQSEQLHIHCWWEHKMVQLLWKEVWHFLKKLTYTDHTAQEFYSLVSVHKK